MEAKRETNFTEVDDKALEAVTGGLAGLENFDDESRKCIEEFGGKSPEKKSVEITEAERLADQARLNRLNAIDSAEQKVNDPESKYCF